MADLLKLALTKALPFEGRTEETAQVYCVDVPDKDDEAFLLALIDACADAEKTAFGSSVQFVRGQIYDFGDLGPNFMRASKDLSGYGSATSNSSIFYETVIELRAPLPRSYGLTRSVKPYLRKFLHTMSLHGADQTGGNAPAWGTPPSTLQTYINWLNDPAPGVIIKSPSGIEPIGPWQFRNVVNHRQFRRGRKEKPD